MLSSTIARPSGAVRAGTRAALVARHGTTSDFDASGRRHKHSLRLDNMNERLKTMQYAVRGQVPIRAAKLDRELREAAANGQDSGKPFEKILYCNIGNPQSVGQKPLSFYRNVLSLVDNPTLLTRNPTALRELFADAEIERATEMVEYIANGTGAYSDSQGVEGIRRNVANFIEQRDGYPAKVENLFLTNGASSGIQMLLTALIASEKDGVMIPIPQYPIYTALISLLGGQQLGYFLDESTGWSLREEELERAHRDAVANGADPRAMVIINPGNPTGSVLSYDDIASVIKFCHKHNMILIADEVYQENVYNPEQSPFVSAKKVACDLDLPVEVASFHSTSKGFIGECGRRGGYMELHNFDPEVHAQIVKLASSGLCSNLDGQAMTDLMVRPPCDGGDTQATFEAERNGILGALKSKAAMVHDRLNAIPGVSCQPLEGAMYAFPSLDLPESFVRRAEAEGMKPDALYALSLLEHTGICTVPGSGFEQVEGTNHVRMTFLPEPEALEAALDRFKEHHSSLK
mmetsp:Transcript_15036/g.47854  ORF Transcript_15036/g.47854 Transcript_15036/m.47854 type:complete len:519 (+) Transcript_15036:108-1664(+)